MNAPGETDVLPKVLQVINSCASGGAEKLAVDLHRHYIARQTPARLLVLHGPVPEDISGTAASLDLPSIRHPSGLHRMMQALRRAEYHGTKILHAHLMPDMIYGPLAAWQAGLQVRRVLTVHSTSNNRLAIPIVGRMLDRLLYQPFDALACISEGSREQLVANHPDLATVALKINNGIDLSAALPANPGRPVDPLVIISVGRLAEVKNFPMLLRALTRLRDLSIELQIVGDGPQRPALEELAQSLGIKGRVKFLGTRNDVAQLLSQAHIFALTPHYEGFGLAVAEAMAAGLPTIVTNVVGMRSLVGPDGNSGFLVQPNDDLTLAERLRFLLTNGSKRTSMGQEAAARASNFSIDTTVDHYLDLYCRLASQHN